MTKQMRELLARIDAKKIEARNALAEGNKDEAKAFIAELNDLEEQKGMLAQVEGEEEGDAPKVPTKQDEVLDDVTAFVRGIKAYGKGVAPTKEVKNALTEKIDADGGLIVPKDIETAINEYKRDEDALIDLITVENVNTLTGVRVFEKFADAVPFDNVDESAQFPNLESPQFEKIEYAIKKKGGVIDAPKELFEDTDQNLKAYLVGWLRKKFKATDNAHILQALDTSATGSEIDLDEAKLLDELKDIFNVELDPAIARGAKVVTNQDGFNILDKLKDADGDYVLQPDPTQATRKLLFGAYPVRVVSNRTLKTTGGVTPFYIGDFKEALVKFDRNVNTIEASNLAGQRWDKDQIGFKARMRADYKVKDAEAFVKANYTTI